MVFKKKSAEAYVKITFSLKRSAFIFKENFNTDVIYMWYMSYIIYINFDNSESGWDYIYMKLK